MKAALRSDGTLRRAHLLARLSAVLMAVAGALSLGGCASVSDKMSQALGSMPAIGLPANTPERPAAPAAYPAVHDMPPQRTTAVLTADEQRSIEKELVSARNDQKAAVAPPAAEPAVVKPAAAARKKPQPAARALPSTVPASSSRMIY